MYSISKRTVLLMDFHYSMLLCVCDILLHLIIYKYWKTPIKNRMDIKYPKSDGLYNIALFG